jgi:hypothetical protein
VSSIPPVEGEERIDALHARAAGEVDHCIIGLRATTPEGALDDIRQIGEDVLPRFR